MCIIAVYNKGINLNEKELENCFNNNSDGAGIMYQEDNHVHILKGFMNYQEFWKAAQKLPMNVDRVFHFRIATTGKVSRGTCHPFPISQDFKFMAGTNLTCDMGMAHNGVLREFEPKGRMQAHYSDTMNFIKTAIYPLQKGELLNNEGVRDLIELYTSSRFAIMTPKDTYLIGMFEQSPESGAWYSNTTYTYSYNQYYYNSCYDDYYWGDHWENDVKVFSLKNNFPDETAIWDFIDDMESRYDCVISNFYETPDRKEIVFEYDGFIGEKEEQKPAVKKPISKKTGVKNVTPKK